MRRLITALLAVVLLASCSQSPFQRLNPVGYWYGSWTGAGLSDASLQATITATSSGWQAVFTSNNFPTTAICSNPDDQGPLYLYCGAWAGAEILVWEGNVNGESWSGVWTYIGPSQNLGGSFNLRR